MYIFSMCQYQQKRTKEEFSKVQQVYYSNFPIGYYLSWQVFCFSESSSYQLTFEKQDSGVRHTCSNEINWQESHETPCWLHRLLSFCCEFPDLHLRTSEMTFCFGSKFDDAIFELKCKFFHILVRLVPRLTWDSLRMSSVCGDSVYRISLGLLITHPTQRWFVPFVQGVDYVLLRNAAVQRFTVPSNFDFDFSKRTLL